ncbi:MAG: zinc-ribbon domain-containing protein [Bacteroidales bacterium]
MAFPLDYKTSFTSFEYPDFRFSQSDFIRLKRQIGRKYALSGDQRTSFSFSFDRVFGFLSFGVTISFEKKKLFYRIDMVPALILVLGIVFISMFITNSTIINSLIIGAVALVVVYAFNLLIVNGMVRRLIEAYVKKEVERLEKEAQNPVCINCGAEMKPGAKVCSRCGYPDNTEKSQAGDSGLNITYSYKEKDKQ